MDSPEISEEESRDFNDVGSASRRSLFRSFIAVALAFSIVLFLSFSVLYVALLIENLSIWSPISVQSTCKIVSSTSAELLDDLLRNNYLPFYHIVVVADFKADHGVIKGVDLRSSKVCELGLLNYKAKHVFYPYERKKYRCHYDYYWASVFEVEYIDHSGQARSALAEAPNEALPDNCRPSFGTAWVTKDKFKVNETYDCWYTLGISKVNINDEGLFDCQAEDPSTVEMLKRYFILFTRLLKSWFSSWGLVYQWRWDLIAGAITGFIMSLTSVTLIGVVYPLIYTIRRLFASWTSTSYPSKILLKRACFFAVYFSFMSWVSIQYLKKLGLS